MTKPFDQVPGVGMGVKIRPSRRVVGYWPLSRKGRLKDSGSLDKEGWFDIAWADDIAALSR